MILVIGGAGYIGSHICKMLSKNGYDVLVYDNLSAGHKEFIKWGEFVKGDLADKELLNKVFENYKIDAVMHFSAFIFVGESVKNPYKYYHNNVANTLNLLNTMLNHNVKNFVFSSTAAVYGLPENIPIVENEILNPINPYGRSKLMVEQILKDFSNAYGLNYVSLRYFNASGADPDGEIGEWHNPETHLIPLVLDAAIGFRENIKIFGTDYDTFDGTCIRDYIHVNDLASAHILALEYLLEKTNKNRNSEPVKEIFNLGNGKGFSVRQIIDLAKKITGKDFKVIETERREGDPPILIASSEKIKKVLGWKPEFDSPEIIIETAWNWHKILYERYKKK